MDVDMICTRNFWKIPLHLISQVSFVRCPFLRLALNSESETPGNGLNLPDKVRVLRWEVNIWSHNVFFSDILDGTDGNFFSIFPRFLRRKSIFAIRPKQHPKHSRSDSDMRTVCLQNERCVRSEESIRCRKLTSTSC